MELFDNLASFGLTTKILQFIIIGAIAIFLLGMFWRFIVVGIGIAFCVAVFAMPSKSDKLDEIAPVVEIKPVVLQEPKVEPMPLQPPPVVEVKPEPKVIEVKPEPKVVEVKPEPKVETKPEQKAETKEQTDQSMFLEDCNLHSGYTQAQCSALWEANKAEILKSSWRYKNDKNYMKRIKNVL
jgi:type IV secretory pathway VirB10-like protein